MAGASMNDIKARIKSVESTMQITKAMELVATSKLRRAKERVERSRPFANVMEITARAIARSAEGDLEIWTKGNKSAKRLIVIIAGDRGLAGGYNSNIFKIAKTLAGNDDCIYLPIGKKAYEHCKYRKKETFIPDMLTASEVGVGTSLALAKTICKAYTEGKIGSVTLVYTRFQSMMVQLPLYEECLPIECDENSTGYDGPMLEEDAEEMLARIIPDYLGGVIYSAVSESLASESGARRSAMNAANKNAEEMIGTLMLKFNRARQAVITQEITEIVSGAEAL